MVGAIIDNPDAADYIGLGLLAQAGGIGAAWGAATFILHRHDRLFRVLLAVAIGSLVFGIALQLALDKSPFRDSDYTGVATVAAKADESSGDADELEATNDDPRAAFERVAVGTPVDLSTGRYTVTSIKSQPSVPMDADMRENGLAEWDGKAPAGKMLVVIVYTYENTTKEVQEPCNSGDAFAVLDADGAEYKLSDSIDDYGIKGNDKMCDSINPHDSAEALTAVIDIPTSVTPVAVALDEMNAEGSGAIYTLGDDSSEPEATDSSPAEVSGENENCGYEDFYVWNGIGVRDLHAKGMTCADAKAVVTDALSANPSAKSEGFVCGPGDDEQVGVCTSGDRQYSYIALADD